ncbi:MAG: phosphatase PAP2 family protein [archaeon]
MNKIKTPRSRCNLLIPAIISLFLFIILLLLVSLGLTNSVDQSISYFFISIQTNLLVSIFILITSICSTIGIVVVGIVIAIYFYLLNKLKDLKTIVLLVFTELIFVYIIKHIISRTRPVNEIIQQTNFSFPSGHAAISIVLFGFLVVFFWNRKRYVSYLLGILILLIGFSRIYLNVHWLTDVIGGYLIGSTILLFGLYFLKRIK